MSLAISPTHRKDAFCWSYTKNGQYTVKSGYWVATHILHAEEETEVTQPSITELQAFAWKVNAPRKIRHLIWKLISGQVAVTRNLIRRNLRCDNYCPRCGETEKNVTNAIFECPPALQAWELSSTPSNPQTFPISSMEIDRDPLELVRYAESKRQAWYNAKESIPNPPQAPNTEVVQALSLNNMCMVDGSWTFTDFFSRIGWVWKDNTGKIQLMGTRNLRRRETTLHSELEALKWALESMLQHSNCQHFGTDCKDLIAIIKEPQAWSNFSTELEAIQIILMCYSDFKITYVPRTHNEIADSLAKNARSFHRSLCFIGCSTPVWLPIPPHI
uniref:RNase H type-1 domain-containing protein n=1 Tax=Brassica oleracea var. oleracea TaxID=109376 RepID=A0A0D3E6G2_BRAOL